MYVFIIDSWKLELFVYVYIHGIPEMSEIHFHKKRTSYANSASPQMPSYLQLGPH